MFNSLFIFAIEPNINNGTELWEANLRNGGQPPPTPTVQKPVSFAKNIL